MKSEVRPIINLMETEKRELEYKRDRAAAMGYSDSVHDYELQIQVLHFVIDKVYRVFNFIDESAILEILQGNYGKYDTELIALNGNKYIINKDEPVGIHENLLFWPGSSEDSSIVPPSDKAINLDNIIEINTLKED